MDVVELHDERADPRHSLEQFPHGPERLLNGVGGIGEPDGRSHVLGNGSGVGIAGDERFDLGLGLPGLILLGDAGGLLHRLGERPEGDALPVRETPRPGHSGPISDTAGEFQRQSRLAEPGLTDDGYEMARALGAGSVQRGPQEQQLLLPADDGRRETTGHAGRLRGHVFESPRPDGLT